MIYGVVAVSDVHDVVAVVSEVRDVVAVFLVYVVVPFSDVQDVGGVQAVVRSVPAIVDSVSDVVVLVAVVGALGVGVSVHQEVVVSVF